MKPWPQALAALLLCCPAAHAQPDHPWQNDPRLSHMTNVLLKNPALTREQRDKVKEEISDLDRWLSDEKATTLFKTMNGYDQVRRYIIDRWILVLLDNASSRNNDKNLYGDGKVNYARALQMYHSMMTSAREIQDPRKFAQFYTIDGVVIGGDSHDFKVRTVEHFATAAHAAYSTGNLPSHLASFMWNTYSVTRRQLEGVVDPKKLPPNSWGEEFSATEAAESIASFWASRKPDAATLRLAGVGEVLFFSDAAQAAGKDPLGVLCEFMSYLFTGNAHCDAARPAPPASIPQRLDLPPGSNPQDYGRNMAKPGKPSAYQ
jgi:hypothetical protein